jgi:phenolic acid decarboxylase
MGTAMPRLEDHIGGPATKDLAGTRLLYTYSTGITYELIFDADDTVRFRQPDVPISPDAPKPKHPVTYRARKIRQNLYLVHWLLRDVAIVHVTLLIDFEEQHVHVCAYMPGGWEFFDMATFKEVERPQVTVPDRTELAT